MDNEKEFVISGENIKTPEDLRIDLEKAIKEYEDSLSWTEKLKDWWEFRIVDPIKTYYYNWKHYRYNKKYFDKFLHEFRGWDYAYVLSGLKYMLQELCKNIEEGQEEDRGRLKKVSAIKEAIVLIDKLRDNNFEENIFTCPVEKRMTEDDIMNKYAEGERRRKQAVKDLLRIFEGQDLTQLPNALKNYDDYVEAFDGTGMMTWWT